MAAIKVKGVMQRVAGLTGGLSPCEHQGILTKPHKSPCEHFTTIGKTGFVKRTKSKHAGLFSKVSGS